jgi:hypothetical protein
MNIQEAGQMGIQVVDTVKRVIVTLVTEVLLFILGAGLLYMLYQKNCNIADIVGLMTIILTGIIATGCGYLGIKSLENIKSNGTNGTAKPPTPQPVGGQTNG